MSERKITISYQMKIRLLIFFDILSVLVSYSFGLWARFDFQYSLIGQRYVINCFYYILCMEAVVAVCYWYFRLYHCVWRFASLPELYRIVSAYIVIAIAAIVLNLFPGLQIPRGAMLLGYISNLVICLCLRFGYRIYYNLLSVHQGRKLPGKRVLIVGAGQAAQEIIKDIRTSHSDEYNVVALVDDNSYKLGRDLEGVTVEGNRYDIPEIVKEREVERIIFAITNIIPAERKEILNICKDTGCEMLMVPGLYQIYSGEMNVSRLKHVEIEDLLGRREIKVNLDQILENLSGKTVMVTGGGGSIGSELCRQIARSHPKQLIIFDIYENTTYEIQQELRRDCPQENVLALIGDVTDRNRVKTVLEQYKPDFIFHAAAHKHVPLMEDSPCEAIKNNVVGTLVMCEEAANVGVKRFLLISTDKAVNPTNVMGASKRLCEMIIQMMARRHTGTVFMAVRFGNVLGSNGSVIPLFKKQIESGGPVTVTDPNIIRYFMTIPEAVSLVLQASYYAKGGEIFVLDMGEPVRIDDMARNLIKLSGFKPGIDIKIEYTGLRPGEKLYEELLMDEEGMDKTSNELIYIGHPIKMDDHMFETELNSLIDSAREENADIEDLVEKVVPTYKKFHKGNELNGQAA